jgi:hypothetical protein
VSLNRVVFVLNMLKINRKMHVLPNPGIRYENLGSYYKTEFDLYLDHKILLHTVYVYSLRLVFQYLRQNYFLK